MTAKKLKRFTVWQGPSEIDGSPIALLALRGSHNRKTGALIQTYILRTDHTPTDIVKRGLDRSICGDCLHSSKGNGGNGTCYVRVDTGPLGVWKAFQRGNYPTISLFDSRNQVAGEKVRLGTYGDPCAVPEAVWRSFLQGIAGCTGYTHAWKQGTAQWLRAYCMASCDTEREYNQARAQGWRAFYVVPKGLAVRPIGSFLCPASEEGGRKLTCSECMACDGTRTERKASVYIPVHGVQFKQQRFSNLIQIGRA